MRQKTDNMRRDQFAILVAVERIADMLYADQHGGPGPIEVRVEYGSMPGWDDVGEKHRGEDGGVAERRFQVKHQSTPLEAQVITDLFVALREAPALHGTLVLRDLIKVSGVGEIRHLRDLSERCVDAEPAYLVGDLPAGQRAWLDYLAESLRIEDVEVVELLGRFAVGVREGHSLRREAIKSLRLVTTDAESAFNAIHSFVARRPDGAVPFQPALVRARILGGHAVPSGHPSHGHHEAKPAWVKLGEDLRYASQRSWWTRLLRFISALKSDPTVAPQLPTERHQPGDPGFLWSYDDAPLDSAEHARLAYRAIEFFAQDEVPRRVGDFSPHSHALSQVQDGDHWRPAAWDDRRRDLFEGWVEPLVDWTQDLSVGRDERSETSLLGGAEQVWVINENATGDPFRWDSGCIEHHDVGSLPRGEWDSARGRRWRRNGWLREVPEPPWATPGTLLYRHEHPAQPYITVFRVNDPPVPLRFGEVVELSDADMTMATNTHLRRHWVPRRPKNGGPVAGRLNHVGEEDSPTWLDGLASGLQPCVDMGLRPTQLVPTDRVQELVAQFGLALRPGSQRAKPQPSPKREPLDVVIATLLLVRDELGLSAMRLGDLQCCLNEFGIDISGTWEIVQSIKLGGLYDPDRRNYFPTRAHPGEVVVVRLPQ